MSATPTNQRGFTFIEALVVLGIIVCLAIPLILAPIKCRAQWEGSGLRSEWRLMAGCRVSKDGKTWIPDERYREIGND